MTTPETRRLHRALLGASEVAAAIARGNEPADLVYIRIAQRVREALEVEVAAVAIVEPDWKVLRVRACAGKPELSGLALDPTDTLGRVAGWSRAEIAPDIGSDPRRGALVERAGIQRAILYPVRAGTRPRGVILAGRFSPAAPLPTEPVDVAMMTLFAEQASTVCAMEEDGRIAARPRESFLAAC